MQNYIQEDSMVIDKIVYEVKSQGIFDQFRKECIADVDTKPAYQNLRQRVEGSVSGFLNKQKWSPDMNKNQVREMLRKNIYESGFLETGVERIVDQVVNPKINSIFLPKVSELVYKFFGIQQPTENKEKESETLLPTDLEAVSPESDKHSEQGNGDDQNLDDSKIDEDESPPFEPLEEQTTVAPEETSIDSHMSGFSGLISHDSNGHEISKPPAIETSNQESITSKQSSDRLSIVMSDDNETKMEVDEPKVEEPKVDKSKKDDKEKKNKDEKNKDDKSKDEKSHRSRHDSRSDKKDKDRKDKHSKGHDRSKDRKDSSSKNGKSESKSEKDKDKERDKSKSHSSSSSHRHSSSSHRSHKDSSSSSKDRDKNKSKSSSSSSSKDKDKYKDDKKKDKDKDSKHHSSSSTSDKHKKDNHHSKSSSSRSKDKKDSKSKDKKECESETKKRNERRSTDRDSNDGHSSLKSSSSSFESFSSTQTAQTSQKEKKTSNQTNSGDSGNSDMVEDVSSAVNLDEELSISTGEIKLFKPKFASNIHEAKRLMKIRRKLAQIENERNNKLVEVKKAFESPPLPSVNVSAAAWDALEAKLNEKIAKENCYKEDSSDEMSDGEKKVMKNIGEKRVMKNDGEKKVMKSDGEKKVMKNDGEKKVIKSDGEKKVIKSDDFCYFENEESPKKKRYRKFMNDFILKLEKDVVEKGSLRIIGENRKRKLVDNSDIKNNNNKKKFSIEVHENFHLPLSPAESDNSIDKKSDISEASYVIAKTKRIIKAPNNSKRYSSEDLYKPRLSFASSRRRMNRNAGID